MMPAMHLAADPSLLALARSAGYGAIEIGDRGAPRDVDAVLVGGPTAWDRIRGWRLAGLRAGVVVVTDEPPEDRARLEPVVLLRHAEQSALAVAVSRLASGRPAAPRRPAGGSTRSPG